MKISVPAYAQKALDMLTQNGYNAYCVGGCIRDSLMGKAPHDWDICTSCVPEKMQEIFADYKTIETGLKHGTLTVLIDGEPLEITTYRTDGDYENHRKPRQVSFVGDIASDLKRRDFTINAMAYANGDFVDVFGGAEDIEKKIIRCVGNPLERFDEDALRIMRCLRFSSVLGFSIDPATISACYEKKNLLSSVSAERIYVELKKLLCGENATQVLIEYKEIIAQIIPQLADTFGVVQNNPHHCYDVWEHICHSIENIKADEALRIVMLLHDIAKPECKTVDENGINHFKKHQFYGADKAVEVLKNLRADNDTIRRVHDLIYEHDNRIPATKKAVGRMISKYGYDFFDDYILVRRADTLAQSDYKRDEKLANLLDLQSVAEVLKADDSCLKISQLEVDGRDMISLGLNGEQIGKALSLCLEAVVDGKIANEKSAEITFVGEEML